MNGHLNLDQMLERLYGVAPHPHVDSCEFCSARYRQIESRRNELAEMGPASSEFLAAQRRKIVARLEQRPHARLKWIPALAAASAIAIGFLVHRPAPAPRPDPGDDQLYSELYSIEQSTDARAAAPIHALFEDNQ